MDIPRLRSDATVWLPRSASAAGGGRALPGGGDDDTVRTRTGEAKPAGSGKRAVGDELSDDQRKQVAELKAIDAKVRQHEQAHMAAGGAHAGSASYSYQEGPDGRRYAVGGEVPIDTGAGRTPEETIRKMEQVKQAALAPADPSPQDQRVAAGADAQKLRAQQELNAQAVEQANGSGQGEGSGAGAGAAPGTGTVPPHAQVARGAAAYGAAAALQRAAKPMASVFA